MKWNWQLPDWPDFRYDCERMAALEAGFLLRHGQVTGAFQHLDASGRELLRVELLSDEAVETSRIEGQFLNRESVQSSIRRHFGLAVDRVRPVSPAEKGIAELLVETYRTYREPLSDAMLLRWHGMMMAGQLDDGSLGQYRSSPEPMQIISGDPFDPEVHFEAPPSTAVPGEMARFVGWFNASSPSGGESGIPALARAAITHLHFTTIHPFVDGNGRIGRALAEKALSQAAGEPLLASLSQTIEARRKDYYQALASTRFSNEVTDWVLYFGGMVLESIAGSLERVGFLIAKARFFARYQNSLNERQEKLLLRLFREGPRGFQGGLSAANYLSITRTTPATARRDLAALVQMGALSRTGERKGTRYWLRLDHG